MHTYINKLNLIPTEIVTTPTYFCITVDTMEQALQANVELTQMGLTDIRTTFCPIGKDFTLSYGEL